MKVENPVALRFLLQDELYLLKADRGTYETIAIAEPEIEEVAPIIKAPEPIAPPPQPVNVTPVLEVKTPPIRFNYMGKNTKRFLVLVHYPNLEFIDDTHLAALTNIIKRKELTVDDLAIVNLAKQTNTSYNDLVSFFKPAKLLVLGPAAMPQGIASLSLNVPAALGVVAGLYSFAFGEMMDNVEYKKAFWEQVKGF